VRRWRGRRSAQQILQNPFPALHHRSPVGVGGDRQDAALAQQSSPVRVGKLDAAELRPVHVRYAVVFRKALVDVRIVSPEQIEHAPVLAQDAGKKQLGFLLEGASKALVEFREHVRIGLYGLQIPDIKPLPGEVAYQDRKSTRL